jgi:6-phosphogluconolactonase
MTWTRIVSIFAFLFLQNCFSQQEYVFFGSYNWDKTTEGIYVYQLDSDNGKLTKVTTYTGISNPSYLTISPSGKYIYACTESKTPNGGSVSSYAFDSETKAFTFLNKQDSGGENPVYVSVHKNEKWLVNGNYTDASFSVYPLLENGSIDSIVQNVHFTEGSVYSKRQEKAHIHSAVFNPTCDYIFFPDLGADKIRIYPFNTTKKEPVVTNEASFIKNEPGSGPRHFTFSPNGKFAYCIEEISGTICAFNYTNNVMKKIQRIATHSEKTNEDFESSDIHISPDGKFLYATNRGKKNNIAIYSITENGLLQFIDYQSTHGKHPRSFAITATGNYVIVTNVTTSNVVVFKRNIVTGLLKKVGRKLKIKNVSCVKTKRY